MVKSKKEKAEWMREYRKTKKYKKWKKEYDARPDIIKKVKQWEIKRKPYFEKLRKKPEYKAYMKIKAKESYQKNKLRVLSKQKKRWLDDSEFRKTHSASTKNRSRDIKYEVFSAYSKKLSKSDIPCCRCCGENYNLIFLTIDHISGRKNVSHRKDLSGRTLYAWLKKKGYPVGFQILCWNCNSAKSDSGICPHKRFDK